MKMEQSTRKRAHMERILFIVGDQNAGKSTLLRSMFVDPRFGTRGRIPTSAKISLVSLSKERCLFVRCTSPHEYGDNMNSFLRKLDRAMERSWQHFWRFNFACAIQPTKTANMPDVVDVCEEIHDRLWPERIRVVQIDPRQDNGPGTLLSPIEIDRLRAIGAEVFTIDGRRGTKSHPNPNGLLLADYFDFT